MADPARRGGAPDDFGVLLSTAFVAFSETLDAGLAAAGFGDFDRWYGFVLRAVADDELSLRELAERLEMSSPGALKIVAAMERAGYLERRENPDDRRVRLVAATDRGREALGTARSLHRAFERRLIEVEGPDAVSSTRAVLAAAVAQGSGRVPRVLRST